MGMNRRSDNGQLRFPQVRRVVLDHFSLYTQRPRIELDVNGGVLCLAGANGIGKSTFLSAVNFGITGIVPLSSREFMSAAEYYKDGVRFSQSFFDGRIEEDDRDSAQISINFDVDQTQYSITRGLFEPDGLRALSITRNGKKASNDPAQSEEERQRLYATSVAEAVGVKTFEQFVFLQHFVLTFDESRHLLFWDSRALEQALYLAFGADPEIAARAEQLRREMEKAESRGRNLKFQATGVFNRIQVIEQALQSTEEDTESEQELRRQYNNLLKERDRLEKDAERAEAKFADAEVALADASATLVTLRKDYESAFSRLTGKSSIVDSHPLIRASIDDRRCSLCGATGDAPIVRIKDSLRRHECPLCQSPLQSPGTKQAELLANLKKLDAALAKAKTKMDSCVAMRERLTKEKAQTNERFTAAHDAVQAFEAKHELTVEHVREEQEGTSSKGLSRSLENLRIEHKTLLAKRTEAYAQRDEKKKELQQVQRMLEAKYIAAEEKFVPLFRNLAELFLGIELDIRLEGKGSTNLVLVFELRNTIRREQHQLSESQRFFVDIALRMAMAQFISSARSPAALLIDTPEGSLDIAYESRAGEMFAKFVKDGHSIMMTANINSSQLLQKLARECGAKRMALLRMTTWTELSEVQIKEDALFQQAYATIESELRRSRA
jgi:DNA repair exonuclease SbcCD ATPase subunit